MLTLNTPIPQIAIAGFDPRTFAIDLGAGTVTILVNKTDAQTNVLTTVQVQLGPARAAAVIAAFKATIYQELQVATGQTGVVS